MGKLLSICIPTYNRAEYLNKCLKSILDQLSADKVSLVEIKIIDNNSSDDTRGVVYNYIQKGFDIDYIRNEANIGLDGNITKAFNEANGKYVQVLGDDDYWLKDRLSSLLKILQGEEIGVLFLNPYSFNIDQQNQHDIVNSYKVSYFKDPNEFLHTLNIMTTFTSSNVINKMLVLKQKDFQINRFLGSDVNLLNWIYTAALRSNRNAITHDFFIASKADNNSGYKLFKVFGENFNSVLNYFRGLGLNDKVVKNINFVLTTQFFPKYLKKLADKDWVYDDDKQEVSLFLKNYRKGDYLNRLFMLNTFNGQISANNEIKKRIVLYSQKFWLKTNKLLSIINNKIIIKVIK